MPEKKKAAGAAAFASKRSKKLGRDFPREPRHDESHASICFLHHSWPSFRSQLWMTIRLNRSASQDHFSSKSIESTLGIFGTPVSAAAMQRHPYSPPLPRDPLPGECRGRRLKFEVALPRVKCDAALAAVEHLVVRARMPPVSVSRHVGPPHWESIPHSKRGTHARILLERRPGRVWSASVAIPGPMRGLRVSTSPTLRSLPRRAAFRISMTHKYSDRASSSHPH